MENGDLGLDAEQLVRDGRHLIKGIQAARAPLRTEGFGWLEGI